MSNTIDFYFDFSSPYAFLGSRRIEAVAEKHGRTVIWQPILLGAIFKVSGQAPLTSYPLKGDYALHDFNRAAREHDVPYKLPDPFPIGAVAASRACCWIKASADTAINDKLTPFVHATFNAYYVEGRNISELDEVLSIANAIGIDAEALSLGLGDQNIKDALKTTVDQAIKIGIKRLVLLGLLLQGLHVLFGITAIMGMLINHMLIGQTNNTIYHSHLRWQLMTFWVSAALYLLAYLFWNQTGALWPALAVLLFTIYRIATNCYYYFQNKPMDRLI